jgi:DNA-binding XRE family transcriptional regulator
MKRLLKDLRNKNNDFGIAIVTQLVIIGKNQQWLAKECNVSSKTISVAVNGKSIPSPKLSERIAQVLELDVTELRKKILSKAS